MEIPPIEEQIRQLVSKLAQTKKDSEATRIGNELRTLLRQHEWYVRRMAVRVAKKVNDDPTTTKAA